MWVSVEFYTYSYKEEILSQYICKVAWPMKLRQKVYTDGTWVLSDLGVMSNRISRGGQMGQILMRIEVV